MAPASKRSATAASPGATWLAEYTLRLTIVKSGIASRSTCIRAEAERHLTPFRRGGRGPVLYRTDEVERWLRGEVPDSTPATRLASPAVQRRRPSGPGSNANALARIDAIARGGGR